MEEILLTGLISYLSYMIQGYVLSDDTTNSGSEIPISTVTQEMLHWYTHRGNLMEADLYCDSFFLGISSLGQVHKN